MRSYKWRTLNLFFLIALILLKASSTFAQASSVTDFKTVVRSGNATTYLDLLLKVFPDAELSAKAGGGAIAHKTIALNHLFGDYKGTVYQEEMKISLIDLPGEQKRNKGQFLMLIRVTSDSGGLSSWNELAVLALFELEPAIKLLDTVDVQADKFSEFWIEQAIIQTSSQTDAVIISNSHHNSSQEYHSITIVAPVNDRLVNVFELPVLLSSKDCGKSITQSATISAVGVAVSGPSNISVNVKSVKDPDDPGCEQKTKGYTKYYKSRLVWNASKRKYVSSGVGLDQLDRFNKKRF